MYVNKNHLRLRQTDNREVTWYKRGEQIDATLYPAKIVAKFTRTRQLVADKKDLGLAPLYYKHKETKPAIKKTVKKAVKKG